MPECMLDLETLGLRPGSTIRSIGAVTFDLDGDGHQETFSMNVRAMSCWIAGLTVDAGTIEWWDKQSAESREAARIDPRDLSEAIRSFHGWYIANGCSGLWCQGAGFDEQILRYAANAVGVHVMPWKYWEVRCTRTLYYAANFDAKGAVRDGICHRALDDAIHQVKCAQASWKLIKGRG
jgi:hypothetical protein